MIKFLSAAMLIVLASANAQAAGKTCTAQVHNAPGWQANHSYTYSLGSPTAPFTRVVAGRGLVALGRGEWDVESGLGAQRAYQLISVGTCYSAVSRQRPHRYWLQYW